MLTLPQCGQLPRAQVAAQRPSMKLTTSKLGSGMARRHLRLGSRANSAAIAAETLLIAPRRSPIAGLTEGQDVLVLRERAFAGADGAVGGGERHAWRVTRGYPLVRLATVLTWCTAHSSAPGFHGDLPHLTQSPAARRRSVVVGRQRRCQRLPAVT